MPRTWMGACLLAIAAFATTANATNIPLNTDGAWNTFDVDDFTSGSGGLEWIDLSDGSALSFSFTAATDVVLKIVDGAFAGDRFRVFDNGNLIGVTGPAASSYPDSLGLDFDAALNNSSYSFGIFQLSAGSHVITGDLFESLLVNGSPLNATVGALSVAPVPLPAGLWLLLSGGGALGALRRRSARNIEVQS